jgi:hypothetical protein
MVVPSMNSRFNQDLTLRHLRMLDPVDQPRDGGNSDGFARHAEAGDGPQGRGRRDAVEAGDGAVLRYADVAGLQVGDERVGLVVGGADPGGDAGPRGCLPDNLLRRSPSG